MAIYMWREMLNYLCFTGGMANSTIQLTKTWSPTAVVLETSTDWANWSTYTIWSTITLSTWDKVYFRNSSTTDTWFSINGANLYKFVMSWVVTVSWDVNFLLNKNSTNTVPDYCFNQLFMDFWWLFSNIKLPATTLWNYCYVNMFRWAYSLSTMPELPATSLSNSCYQFMFMSCTNLTSLSNLPATTLWDSSYVGMFRWCTNLEQLPKLPATTISNWWYQQMFYGCSKIKLSSTQTWEYQTAYRIPTTWTWSAISNSFQSMFASTWWTFTSDPTVNTTYYTSNTLV